MIDGPRSGWCRLVAAVALAAAAACGRAAPERDAGRARPPALGGEPAPATASPAPTTSTASVPPSAAPPTSGRAGGPPPPKPPPASPKRPPPPPRRPPPTLTPGTVVEVPYRLERRTSDPATAGFEALAEATLADPRGWGRSGFRLVRRPGARFVVVLAEGSEVDALCLPYETYATYSCQNGPVVALNADRWRSATPKWTGTLEDYRRYLVGHEVGHLLGLRHPRPQCPAPGRPAPLMAQQSTELDGCLPNPWPLPAEVEEGRRRPADLAPPYRP